MGGLAARSKDCPGDHFSLGIRIELHDILLRGPITLLLEDGVVNKTRRYPVGRRILPPRLPLTDEIPQEDFEALLIVRPVVEPLLE